MYFKPQIHEREIPETIAEFVSIAGELEWKTRLQNLTNEVQKQTGLSFFYNQVFRLEIAFSELWDRCQKGKPISVVDSRPGVYQFLAFSAMVVKVYQNLSPSAQKRLSGMLKAAIRQRYGLNSIAFEMEIATHLMMMGYDVEFHDLESEARYDFFITKDNIEIELECKYVSIDKGRQIHRKELRQFDGLVFDWIKSHLNSINSSFYVRLTIPGRLKADIAYQDTLLGSLKVALMSGSSRFDCPECSIDIEEFDLDSISKVSTNNGVDLSSKLAAVIDRYALSNKNVMVFAKNSKYVILLSVDSEIKDEVINVVFKEWQKSTKNQFTTNRTGVLCCRFADLSLTNLLSIYEDITDETKLKERTSNLLGRRDHLHSITYIADHSANLSQPEVISGATRNRQPTYTIKNSKHPAIADPRFDLFSDDWYRNSVVI